MKLDVDSKQRVAALAQAGLEFYKVSMGAFLVVFVPQTCDGKACSISDNVTRGDAERVTALASNAVTFLIVLCLYCVELWRENWCITYLDIDPDRPNSNLDTEIEAYPLIKLEMYRRNSLYMNAFRCASSAMVLNFAVSFVALSVHGTSLATILAMASYLLLVGGKLSTVHDVAKASLREERAFSAYLMTPKTYNTIDVDHRTDAVFPLARRSVPLPSDAGFSGRSDIASYGTRVTDR